MFFVHRSRSVSASCAVILFILLVASAVNAQTKQLLTWQEELAYLQNLRSEDLIAQRDGIVQIRAGIELWLKLHPNTAIKLAEAPPQPWNAEQTASQVF
jgi:hypothetical protein